MSAAPFDRGRAARRKGLPKSASPYKHPDRQTGSAFDWERRASEWDEGWHSELPRKMDEQERKGAMT